MLGSRQNAAIGWTDARPLTQIQRLALDIIARTATEDAAIVVTNAAGGAARPIVHASENWRRLCGPEYSAHEHPDHGVAGLLLGAETDAMVIKALRCALAAGRGCKALVRAYRGTGASACPFWCYICVSPVRHRGALVLCSARLQDYSDLIAKLAMRTPVQFYSSTQYHQRHRLLPAMAPSRILSVPAVFELDQPFFLSSALASAATGPRPSLATLPLITRLGWYGLQLEPEHLLDCALDARAPVRLEPHVGLEGITRVGPMGCAARAGCHHVSMGPFPITAATSTTRVHLPPHSPLRSR